MKERWLAVTTRRHPGPAMQLSLQLCVDGASRRAVAKRDLFRLMPLCSCTIVVVIRCRSLVDGVRVATLHKRRVHKIRRDEPSTPYLGAKGRKIILAVSRVRRRVDRIRRAACDAASQLCRPLQFERVSAQQMAAQENRRQPASQPRSVPLSAGS